MTEEKIFEPITTQAEFDERLKTRLAREKEKWEKQSGVENLKAQLNAKAQEIAYIKNSYYLEDARRAVVGELASRGVTDEERIQRVMKLIDLEGIEPDQDGAPARGAVLTIPQPNYCLRFWGRADIRPPSLCAKRSGPGVTAVPARKGG